MGKHNASFKQIFSNKRTQTDLPISNSEMSTSFLASIEKLRGRENYSTWKFCIENYLELEDLSKCITGEETCAKKNSKAKAAINLSIDKVNFVHVKSAKTVKEVWDNLKATFEDQGAVRKVTLMRKIVNTKLENCNSMDVYVSEIMSTAQKLTEVGFDVPDEWLAIFLLSGLNDDYMPMIMAIESTDKKLSSDSIKTKLLQETNNTSSSEKAFFAKGRQNNKRKEIICYSCRQKGHKSNSCPEKSKKPDGNKSQKHEKNSKSKDESAFSAVFLSGNFRNDEWFMDSGATRHLTMRSDWMKGEKQFGIPPIRAANNEAMDVECSGAVNFSVIVDGESRKVQFKDVLCVPKLTANLLSVSEITAKQKIVVFSSRGCVVKDMDGTILATASLVNGLYRLDGSSEMVLASIASNVSNSMELWHRRLGHLNPSDMSKMKNGGVDGISFDGNEQNIACVACCKGKQARKPFPKNGSRATKLLEIVHADLAGKMDCESIGGCKYCLVLVDDFSRMTFVYMLKNKSETFEKFCNFKQMVQNQTGLRIKKFRSDNGTEFVSSRFKAFFEKHGIQHQTSIPYTPQKNGLAERTIRTLTEKARCMLQDVNLPKCYWAEAINTAAYIKNHTTSNVLENKSPIEIWSGKKPDISHFKVFGSLAMAMIPKEKRQKFDPKSQELMFVGYGESQKGYRLIDRESKQIVMSRDVTVIEHGNIYQKLHVNKDSFKFIADDDFAENTSVNESDINDATVIDVSHNEGEQHVANDVAIETNTTDIGVQHGQNNAVQQLNEPDTSLEETFDEAVDDGSIFVPEEDITINNDSDFLVRRSARETKQTERFQSTHLAYLAYESTSINNEPVTVRQALNGSDKIKWQAAMDDEYRSLIENKTWDLVQLPNGCKAISNKWVFKQKTDSNGNVIRYKARVVVKGCSQREGIDFVETFSPVVRYSSIRLLIAITVKFALQIEQMDVVTAFLHGDIKETIYMKQPEGFDDNSGKVCRLKKALYGLKQASRQWNIKLNEVLLKAGFNRCKSDACIYHRRNGDSIVIVAVYVDDLLIFFNNIEWKDQLKSILKQNFKMKDLGSAANVLGIHIDYDQKKGVIKLDQRKYTEAILRKFRMFDCDPVKLPKDPNQKLTKEMSPANDTEYKQMDSVPYQEAVGSILYLTQCTRPDVAFPIAVMSQFNNNPGKAHWTAVKRIFRYLKGTLELKLVFAKDSKYDDLCCYSDSDWASNFCDFKSCTGYVFVWQGAAISWQSKKQPTVALSTAEAEYMALTSACQEAISLNQLKDEILGTKAIAIEIYCDNKGAIDLCVNGNYSAKTKHINIRLHFNRDLIEKRMVKITKIGTDLMVADGLTKAVPIAKHLFCLNGMGLKN